MELGLGDAGLFNFLGIAYSRTARQQRAIDAYRKSLQLDPQLAEAHLNLAYAYEQTHKPQPARQEYQEACRLKNGLLPLREVVRCGADTLIRRR